MSSFRRRSLPVVAPAAEAISVVPAQYFCCLRLPENGDATSEKNPQNGIFVGSPSGRGAEYSRTSGLSRSPANGHFAPHQINAASEFSFWTNPAGRVVASMLKRQLQRALALQLLAKSDRLHRGGCALKRLSEDFRVCHGRGWLGQRVLRDRPMSSAAHPFYSRLIDLRLRGERSRKQEAVAPIDRRPRPTRLDFGYCGHRDSRIARSGSSARRPTGPARSPLGVVTRRWGRALPK
jgi:hypothetical protein